MTSEVKPSRSSRAWGVVKHSVVVGGRTGLKTAFELLVVMVPVMVVMLALEALDVLPMIGKVFEPLMRMLGLPGSSALAFISGAFVNLYSAVAVAANLSLNVGQLTVLAILCQACHNLPVECAVQKKAGTGVLPMIVIRFVTGFLGAWVVSLLIGWFPAAADWTAPATQAATVQTMEGRELIGARAAANGILLVKIVGIVLALMILVEFLRETGCLKVLTTLMRPVTWLAGLPRQAAFTVMTSSTLGLAYGAGTVIAEARAGHLSREEQFRTNVFIGTTHSLVEDVALFAVLGASVLWMLLSRLVIGCGAVRVFALLRRAIARQAAPEPVSAEDPDDSSS